MNYLGNYDSVCPFVIKLRLGLLAYDQLFIKSIIINDTTIRDIMRYYWPRKQIIKKYIIMQHIQQVALYYCQPHEICLLSSALKLYNLKTQNKQQKKKKTYHQHLYEYNS